MISGIGTLCINQEKIAVLTEIEKAPLGEIIKLGGYLLSPSFEKLLEKAFLQEEVVHVEFVVGQAKYASKGYISSLTIEKNSECPFCEFEIHELRD